MFKVKRIPIKLIRPMIITIISIITDQLRRHKEKLAVIGKRLNRSDKRVSTCYLICK